MKVLDIDGTHPHPMTDRRSTVLHEAPGFTLRTIELPPMGEVPPCKMDSHVVFYIVRGAVELEVEGLKRPVSEGQCFVTGPATLSMRSGPGARILGIAIDAR
jgi:quercetin dioxygenase-like cupin family protein